MCGEDWAAAGFADRIKGPYSIAEDFLERMGLVPNEDAIDQLLNAFLPALKIICERDHEADGSTWKKAGWKPQLHEIFKKTDRVNYGDWRRTAPSARVAMNEAPDLINYWGFYLRGRKEGIPAWGEWGEPDSGLINTRGKPTTFDEMIAKGGK